MAPLQLATGLSAGMLALQPAAGWAQATSPVWEPGPEVGPTIAWLGEAPSLATPAGWGASFPLPAEDDWQGVADPGRLPPGYPSWSSRDPDRRAEAAHAAELKRPKPIAGIGGGVRIGSNSTNGMVSGRIGHELSSSVALSLRPALIFGNADLRGRTNNQSEFQLPLTLDLFPRSVLSPYIGGGIVNNANSSGQTDGLLSAGIDLNLSRHLSLGVSASRIFQNRGNDNNWEALTQIYFRY